MRNLAREFVNEVYELLEIGREVWSFVIFPPFVTNPSLRTATDVYINFVTGSNAPGNPGTSPTSPLKTWHEYYRRLYIESLMAGFDRVTFADATLQTVHFQTVPPSSDPIYGDFQGPSTSSLTIDLPLTIKRTSTISAVQNQNPATNSFSEITDASLPGGNDWAADVGCLVVGRTSGCRAWVNANLGVRQAKMTSGVSDVTTFSLKNFTNGETYDVFDFPAKTFFGALRATTLDDNTTGFGFLLNVNHAWILGSAGFSDSTLYYEGDDRTGLTLIEPRMRQKQADAGSGQISTRGSMFIWNGWCCADGGGGGVVTVFGGASCTAVAGQGNFTIQGGARGFFDGSIFGVYLNSFRSEGGLMLLGQVCLTGFGQLTQVDAGIAGHTQLLSAAGAFFGAGKIWGDTAQATSFWTIEGHAWGSTQQDPAVTAMNVQIPIVNAQWSLGGQNSLPPWDKVNNVYAAAAGNKATTVALFHTAFPNGFGDFITNPLTGTQMYFR